MKSVPIYLIASVCVFVFVCECVRLCAVLNAETILYYTKRALISVTMIHTRSRKAGPLRCACI